jgi:putative transcriptional regulator
MKTAASKRGATIRKTIDPASPVQGRIDPVRVDATTECDIAAQHAQDETEAMQDAARFARRVRQRLGLSQVEFSRRIDVPLDTIRNQAINRVRHDTHE